MSVGYDKHAKIRVTPKNLKAIEFIRKRMTVRVSRDAVANALIQQGFQAADTLKRNLFT